MAVHRIIFFLFILGFVFFEISSSHIFTDLMLYQETKIWQAYIMLGFGAFTFSDGSMRERAALDVLFLWVVWVFVTDFIPYFPPVFASIETASLIALLSWVYFRPYRFIPAPIRYGTVYIAFYGGKNAPFMSRMAANFGFPFSSIAVIANELAVRPSKSRGCMVETPPILLEKKGYIFIDTGIEVTPEIIETLESVRGTKTGYGWFRVKCLMNFLPVLKSLGPQWVPKNFPLIPSLYYRQCSEASAVATDESRVNKTNE